MKTEYVRYTQYSDHTTYTNININSSKNNRIQTVIKSLGENEKLAITKNGQMMKYRGIAARLHPDQIRRAENFMQKNKVTNEPIHNQNGKPSINKQGNIAAHFSSLNSMKTPSTSSKTVFDHDKKEL